MNDLFTPLFPIEFKSILHRVLITTIADDNCCLILSSGFFLLSIEDVRISRTCDGNDIQIFFQIKEIHSSDIFIEIYSCIVISSPYISRSCFVFCSLVLCTYVYICIDRDERKCHTSNK